MISKLDCCSRCAGPLIRANIYMMIVFLKANIDSIVQVSVSITCAVAQNRFFLITRGNTVTHILRTGADPRIVWDPGPEGHIYSAWQGYLYRPIVGLWKYSVGSGSLQQSGRGRRFAPQVSSTRSTSSVNWGLDGAT